MFNSKAIKVIKSAKDINRIMLAVMPKSYYLNGIVSTLIMFVLGYGYLAADIEIFLNIFVAWYIIGMAINAVIVKKELTQSGNTWSVVCCASMTLLVVLCTFF
jgi:hypothetical protein